jgi:hypothetical protein
VSLIEKKETPKETADSPPEEAADSPAEKADIKLPPRFRVCACCHGNGGLSQIVSEIEMTVEM